MKDKLRANGYFLSALKNKIEKKIQPLNMIKVTSKERKMFP